MEEKLRQSLYAYWGWFKRNEALFIAGMIAGLFFAGYWGYLQVLPRAGSDDSALQWDAVYSAIKLFIFNGPDVTQEWPFILQVVRILAPFLLIYTAVKTLWLRAGEHISLFLLRFRYRRFVVVCGIGETGYRLALQYLQCSKKRVVLIDDRPMNPLVAKLNIMGAIALMGDALDGATLARARVASASEVFVFSGDDEKNVAVAKAIHRVVRTKSSSAESTGHVAADRPRLRCHIQVDTGEVAEIFQDHSFFNLIDDRLELRIFNRNVSVARNIMDKCAPDLYYRPASDQDEPMHVLFLGFGPLSQALLIQYALTAHYADFRKPSATVLCDDQCRRAVDRFRQRYTHIDEVLDLTFRFVDPQTLDPQSWKAMLEQQRFQLCYTALEHDVDGILAARRLNRMRNTMGVAPIHFVVCLNQQSWISEVVDDDFLPIEMDKTGLGAAVPIEYFETLDETITIDVVVNDRLDQLAVAIHERYLQGQIDAGTSRADNPSVVTWRYLPLYKKVANQRAAAHLDVKLRIALCRRAQVQAPLPRASFPPNSELMEVLAKVEHQRWCADKRLAGYRYGAVRDDVRFLHPDLKPWGALTESDREKDRALIREIPALLALIGQKVVSEVGVEVAAQGALVEEEAGP
ncbi:NAD-binding protein [Microbulbifer salipaludis]|uniref:NAD-binding protein n=1 Tax=Microbulbifer salipaludis TaxID=187980 RepID=A0ABS3E414_9GAMM|nr:NAD-binding protein [Microbulbifer salipaludis]MBN8430017.1 NAD-binding protein [Microbulbifer salipaludis]